MTISTTVCKVSYPGDGAQVTFPFNFLIPEGAIRVYVAEGDVITLVEPNNYGVIGFDQPTGGSVTFNVAPTATQTVMIRRYLEPTQSKDLLPPMAAYVDMVEGVLDRHAMVMQQLGYDLSRAVMVPEGSCQTPEDLLEDILKGRDGSPVGQVAAFAMTAVPEGWLECNGAPVSRTTFADLFAAIGETYGAGDGSTTFNLPDLRGEFLRGWDNGRGVDAGRVIGSNQDGEFSEHYHHSGLGDRYADAEYTRYGVTTGLENLTMYNDMYGTYAAAAAVNSSSTGGAETRPRNIAVMYCIKAFHSVVNPTELDVSHLANDVAKNAADVASAPFAEAFVSAEQEIVKAGSVTLLHGLSSEPSMVQLRAVCKVAEAGYAVGDSVVVAFGEPDDNGCSVVPNASEIFIRYGASHPLTLLNKSTGYYNHTTEANWRLVVRAWA